MKKIYIELSDICNLACSFCPATKGKRGIMGVKDFAYCLKEAFGFSRHIALHILGDPCALENLGEYLKIARKVGTQLQKIPKIDIVTSGAFFGKHSIDMLLSPPIFQLSISLEAGVDNFFKRVSPKNDFSNIDFGKNGVASKDFGKASQNPSQKNSPKRFGEYLDSIIALCCAHKANPQIFLNLRIQDLRTMSDKSALRVICKNLAPLVDFEFLSRQSGKAQVKEDFLAGNIGHLLDIKGRIRLWEKALLVVRRSFVWAGFDNINVGKNVGQNPKRHRKYRKCYALTQQVGILSNGIVVPCCIDAQGVINLGNVFENPLKQILDCARARNIIEGFRLGEAREELCRSCGFWE